MTDTAIEDRVAQAITDGKSLRLVRRELSISEAALDQILEKIWPLSTEARLRTIRSDLGKLDRLIDKLYEKGLAGDTNAAVACIRAWERKAAMLGLDAAQRIDLQVVQPVNQTPDDFQRIKEAIFRVARGPDWKPSDGNGSGAVDALSDLGDTEPSR